MNNAGGVDPAGPEKPEEVDPAGPEQAGRLGPDGEQSPPDGDLSPLERRILEIEGKWFRHAGSKEALVRQELKLSGVAYHQLLNRLLDRPEALRFAPVTVNRLRERREGARRRGSAGGR